MKKTKVKQHTRRTKKKVVPVRKHTRKNRGATVLGKLVDKKIREGEFGITDTPTGTKTSLNYEAEKVKKMSDPIYKEGLEFRYNSFINSPAGKFINKKFGDTEKVYFPEQDDVVEKFTPAFKEYEKKESDTPYADRAEREARDSFNAEISLRKRLKNTLKDKGDLTYEDYQQERDKYFDDLNKLKKSRKKEFGDI